jgi:transposase
MGSGRRWSVEQKRLILEEYEGAPHGAKGAVLRRHRITYSQLVQWATYRDHGILETGWRRGMRVQMTPKAESAEIGRLRAEVRRLQAELDNAQHDRLVAEAATEALGKAFALLQLMLESAAPTDPSETSSPAASESCGKPA